MLRYCPRNEGIKTLWEVYLLGSWSPSLSCLWCVDGHPLWVGAILTAKTTASPLHLPAALWLWLQQVKQQINASVIWSVRFLVLGFWGGFLVVQFLLDLMGIYFSFFYASFSVRVKPLPSIWSGTKITSQYIGGHLE